MKIDVPFRPQHDTVKTIALFSALHLLAACAADPSLLGALARAPAANSTAANLSLVQAAQGARISFHYSDFYTLTNPNQSSCAGDARTVYDPLAIILPHAPAGGTGYYSSTSLAAWKPVTALTGATGPVAFPKSTLIPGETLRPAFIKNIAVDMTDASASITANLAQTCSLGNSSSAPPTSNCATFDYGAIGGIPTSLGGTLLLVGGITSYDWAGRNPTFPFQGHTVSCGPIKATSGAGAIISPTGFTSCSSGTFALGVNTLPASVFNSNPDMMPAYQGSVGPTGPVSTWANISGAQGYTGPQGSAGAAAAYDQGLQKVLLFAGAAPLSGTGSMGPGITTYDTWVFDLKSQAWNYLNANIYLPTAMQTLSDMMLDIRAGGAAPTPGGIAPTPELLQKAVGSRALFGYSAVPGMAMSLDSMSTTGAMMTSMIDKTDRLVVTGGIGPLGTLLDTHRFNPTYGPEIQDAQGAATGIPLGSSGANGLNAVSASVPSQWVDSYHTQLLSNTYGLQFAPTGAPNYLYTQGSSLFAPTQPPLAAGPTGGQDIYNSSFAPLVNNSVAAPTRVVGTGYVAALGGFNASTLSNVAAPVGTTVAAAACNQTSTLGGAPTLNCGGGISIMGRMTLNAAFTVPTQAEVNTSHFTAIPNFLDSIGTPNTPIMWNQIAEATVATVDTAHNPTVPFLGGATLLPGFVLGANDLAFFGGTDCKNYLSDASAPCSAFKNPGRYWTLGADPLITALPADAAVPLAWNNPPVNGVPTNAGMAAARGLDGVGNIIIVAWSGASGPAVADSQSSNEVHYLSNPAAKVWHVATQAAASVFGASGSGDIPTGLVNAAMVFSHVTHKFYVFGGYEPSAQKTHGDTYELAVTGDCTLGGCSFTWRQLSGLGKGLSCYPATCPLARRSHRMAEVNYFNRNPGGSVLASGEQPCLAGQPCSYGIFMEGGTPDGYHYMSDRWMFDPTANAGYGHWQQMGELPPRTLAAMSSVDLTIPTNSQTVHRAIMFGGETGMQSPEMTFAGNFYVAPTLGDTWIFDYDTNSWNRVTLLGKGYKLGNPILPANYGSFGSNPLPISSEWERRQAYPAASPAVPANSIDMGMKISELSPPPISGALMITRTMRPQIVGSPESAGLHPLVIPEVYLLGGRLKDGTLNTLDHVYKFCLGSTGESFTLDPLHFLAGIGSTLLSVPNKDDYSCDAYDPTNNPTSPSPSRNYVGRWLTKSPDGPGGFIAPLLHSSQFGSFMGAAAYDPTRDRIVLIGGLGVNAGTLTNSAVTDSSAGSGVHANANSTIFEYTPPQPQLIASNTTPREGEWNIIGQCLGSGIPAPRYGHSLGYDTLNHALVMTGGFKDDGTPLSTTLTTPDGRPYTTPEVWTANFYPPFTGLNNTAISCYYWRPITLFGNSIDIQAQAPPTGNIAHAASVYIPATGFNTGYYSMFDHSCEKAGPIATPDPSINKLLAGGAYIDLDRSQLGANENLILNLTYIPLGITNLRPDATPLTVGESAIFKIHLMKTGQPEAVLQQIPQPRYMNYADPSQYPQVAQDIAVLAPPSGQIVQEQIYIPLSIDPAIDRIRIERYSGTGILLEASIFRMGSK